MGKQVASYPPSEQRKRWEKRAEEMDMSMSEFLSAMVEAGLKKFERDVEPDFTNSELREQRDELRKELNEARERIQHLEERVFQGERQAVLDYIEDNPSAEYHDILNHLNVTAGERLTDHLDFLTMENMIESNEERQYFAVGDSEGE